MAMQFEVEEPNETTTNFFEQEPEWPCHNGHEECSYRPGGPCWQFECTCETTGRCRSCVTGGA